MFEDKLRRSLVGSIQSMGLLMYTKSLLIVPVVTGQLKRSSFVRYEADGITIGFNAPYAEAVENRLNSRVYLNNFKYRAGRFKGQHGIDGYLLPKVQSKSFKKQKIYTSGRYLEPAILQYLNNWPTHMIQTLQRDLS